MPDVHHVFSPSSAHRHLECVGYLIGPELQDRENDASIEGSVCHKLLEYSMYGIDVSVMLGQDLTHSIYSNGEPALVTAEMISAVKYFTEVARELMLELGIPETEYIPERHLVHPDVPEELFGGTSDFTAIGEDVMLIIDLKYGTKPVEGDSPQLTEYLLLAMAHLPPEKRAKIKRFVQVIVQPRVAFGELVRRHEPALDEINVVWEKLWAAVQMYLAHRHLPESPPELLIVGKHCRYCPRQMHCPAITREMSDAATLALAPVDTTSEGFIDKLIYWSDRKEAITSFFTAVERALVTLAEQGHIIPGRKLVGSFGNREWIPEMKDEGDTYILRRLKRVLDIPAEKARNVTVKSPAQIEALLKEEGRWKSDKELQSKFHGMVNRPLRGVRLVEESAPGDVVTPALAATFQNALKEYGES